MSTNEQLQIIIDDEIALIRANVKLDPAKRAQLVARLIDSHTRCSNVGVRAANTASKVSMRKQTDVGNVAKKLKMPVFK